MQVSLCKSPQPKQNKPLPKRVCAPIEPRSNLPRSVYTDSSDKPMPAKVTAEEVARVAELAHLDLTPEEIPAMVKDLNAILDYVAELSELDTTGIVPLAQVTELPGAGGAAELRSDAVEPSLSRAAVMPEAPESDGRFFKVPKVIER